MSENNIHRLEYGEKEIILIGTAHVSKKSAEEVKEVIESETPDSVCIELDEGRYKSIKDKQSWQNMDIMKVIKQKKTTLLLVNLIMSSFQKRMAKQIGVNSGAEMMQGIKSAEEAGVQLVLADRNIQITFSRIWRGMGFKGKMKLIFIILGSIFSNEEISEEELDKLKKEDMLVTILGELADSFPELKTTLLDERDQYLAKKIKEAPGKKIVAIVGAAHVPGIKEEIHKEQDLAKLNYLPPKKSKWKYIAWAIPALIIALIIATFVNNKSAGFDQVLYWIMWNGSLSALGTLAALGHPLSIITAFVVAPITSLNPLIAAGWFAGFVEAVVRKPKVSDLQNLSGDIMSVKGFWKNRVTRILLIIIFANIGSALGTFIGGAEVVRVFFQSIGK